MDLECTTMSSRYTRTNSMPWKSLSIILWKVAGAFMRPNGITSKWYVPYLQTKVVISLHVLFHLDLPEAAEEINRREHDASSEILDDLVSARQRPAVRLHDLIQLAIVDAEPRCTV